VGIDLARDVAPMGEHSDKGKTPSQASFAQITGFHL
jgi:hypothetical protein